MLCGAHAASAVASPEEGTGNPNGSFQNARQISPAPRSSAAGAFCCFLEIDRESNPKLAKL
jgi:hypothetical protein